MIKYKYDNKIYIDRCDLENVLIDEKIDTFDDWLDRVYYAPCNLYSIMCMQRNPYEYIEMGYYEYITDCIEEMISNGEIEVLEESEK